MSSSISPWFAAAFPDHFLNAASCFPLGGKRIWADIELAQHWGSWRAEEFRCVSHSQSRAVVIGHCFAANEELSAALACMVRTGQPEKFTQLPGSFIVLVFQPDGFTVISDLAGQFPIYYEKLKDFTIVTSCAHRINRKNEVDKLRLSASLICAYSANIVGYRSCLSGMKCLPPASILKISRGGSVQIYQYWTPNFEQPRDFYQAAQGLQFALENAVSARVNLGFPVSTDFSGGLDSTSLAFLATRHLSSKKLPAFTAIHPEAPAGDAGYAERYAKLNDRFDWRFVSYSLTNDLRLLEVPWVEDVDLSFPMLWTWFRDYMQQVNPQENQIHLLGTGGDDLLTQGAICIADLLREGRLVQFFHQSLLRARLRYSTPLELWKSGLQLARTNPTAALHRVADQIKLQPKDTLPQNNVPQLWPLVEGAVDLLTASIRRELEELVRDTARKENEEFGTSGVGNYQIVKGLRFTAQSLTGLRFYVEDLNVQLHAPFLDRDVVKACLSLPSYQRIHPQQFKFLLREALRGIVPDVVLLRQSKGNYSASFFRQLQQELPLLRNIFHSSALVDLGIVKPDCIDSLINHFDIQSGSSYSLLMQILTAELWIRGLERHSFDTRSEVRNNVSTNSPQIPVLEKVENSSLLSTTESIDQCYGVSDLVRLAVGQTGYYAVLNLHTNSYQVLNPIASVILRTLHEKGTISYTVDRLVIKYANAGRARLESDVTRCVKDWLAKGIIAKRREPSKKKLPNHDITEASYEDAGETVMSYNVEKLHHNQLSRIQVSIAFIISLVLGKFSIKTRLTTLLWCQRILCKRNATKKEARQLQSLAYGITHYYPGRVACLEISYTTALAAALTRKKVQWHLGASFEPPAFHAWIEVEGEPIRTAADDPVDGVYYSFFKSEEESIAVSNRQNINTNTN